jgi:hypothetical protein
MRLIQITRVSLFFLTLLFISEISSCNSDTNSEEHGTDDFLAQAKPGLDAYIDSASMYCDKLLTEYRAGTNKELLATEYGPKIKYYENSINEALDKANIIRVQKKLLPGVYERWLSSLNLEQLADKNKKLRSIGIDLSNIAADNNIAIAPRTVADSSKSILPQTYSDKKDSFILNLPKDWTITEKEQEGMRVIIASPANNIGAGSNASFEVNIMDYTDQLSTEDFYNGNIAMIQNNSKDFKLLRETEIDIYGVVSKCAVFSCIKNNVSITSLQIFFFQNKKGYILNGTSTSDYFNEYSNLYVAIIKSFRMQNNK